MDTLDHTRTRATPSSGSSTWRRRGRLVALVLTTILPGPIKRWVYRVAFGYRIGSGVRLGWSVIDATECTIDDHARIGHGNLFLRIAALHLGEHVQIGHLNIVRGGESVRFGRYSMLLRLNVINAIPDNDCTTNPRPRFTLGDASVVTAGHRLDFTDTIAIGRHSIVGGRNSSFWTHSRQRTKPITLGDQVFVGSEVRLAPGAAIGSRSVVGLGSVVVGPLLETDVLIAGFPARVLRPLREPDRELIRYPTRPDLPAELRVMTASEASPPPGPDVL